MKNKFTLFLMAALLIFSALPVEAQAATTFTDVNNHWAKNEIKYLSDRNIIGGYPDGTFKPNQPITRAQAAAMMVKALKIPLTTSTTIEFKDVSKKSPYYQILATVNEKGILRGQDGYMHPGQNASRAHMAAIIRRAFDMPLDKQATYIDVPDTHWAYQDINSIAKQRVAGGFEGKFMPTDSVTRAQFSAFLVRALDDKMKLSKYRSYVSTKGKQVEQDGYSYFITYTDAAVVIKEQIATGKREVLLSGKDIPKSPWEYEFPSYLGEDFQLVVYNDEVYIPYSTGYNDSMEAPIDFALMKIEKNNRKLVKMEQRTDTVFRNMFIWNDRIYFTNYRKGATVHLVANKKAGYSEDLLSLYSTAMDGKTDRKKEYDFNAIATFDRLQFSYDPDGGEIGGENRSVLFDHSTVYYFNETGVYKYNLLTKKTSKFTDVVAQEMYVADADLVVVDRKGKKFTFKK